MSSSRKKVAGASSSHSEAREQDAPATKVVGASSSPVFPVSREQDAPATIIERASSSFPPAPLWEYFNPLTEIDVRTGGNLPHWEQGSVWYFVTFRLADALPRTVIEEIKRQREHWRQTHDLNNLSREELTEYHQLFSERYEELLHAGNGSCVLRDPPNAKIVCDALRHFDGDRYSLDEYIVMPNHVHLLVKPLGDHRLVNILHSWKSFTANRLNRRLRRTGQLWQHESYDHIVRNDAAMHAIRRYIRNNPKVAGASSSRSLSREQDTPSTIQRASSSPLP